MNGSDKNFTAKIKSVLDPYSNYSQSDLGEYIGVSRQTISDWAEGSNLPHESLRESLYKLIQEFGDQ